MVVLGQAQLVGEAECHRQFYLVIRLILPVAADPFRLPELHWGQRLLTAQQLGDIVLDAVFIEELLLGKATRLGFAAQQEQHPGVHHGLALEDIPVVVRRYGDVGKHLQIRLPANGASGVPAAGGGFLHLLRRLTLLEVKLVDKAIPANGDIHIL